MTALCGGGASQIKSGVAGQNIIGGGLISEGLTLISPWLLPLGLFIDAFLFDATAQCTSDPPAVPTFTSDDLTNCIGGVLNPNCPQTLAKVKDLLLNWLWFQFCECSATTTPSFVQPTPPSGVNTPGGTVSAGCFSGSFSGTPTQDSTPTTNRPSNLSLMPIGATSNHNFGSGQIAQTVQIPVGQYTKLHVTGSVSFPASATKALVFELNEFNAAGTFIGNPFQTIPASAGSTVPVDVTIAIDATAAFIGLEVVQTDEPHPSSVSLSVLYSCTGSTAGGVATPCPPDPAVAAMLNQIYQLLTLIQRQQVPFAFIPGTSHTGLSGSGEITFSSILGAKVNPSAIPNWSGLSVGDPDELWLDSWIAWGNADGFISREFLTHAPYISMPRYAGQFTRLGYTLAPGVTVDITELIRES